MGTTVSAIDKRRGGERQLSATDEADDEGNWNGWSNIMATYLRNDGVQSDRICLHTLRDLRRAAEREG